MNKKYRGLYRSILVVCLLLVLGGRSYAMAYEDIYGSLSELEKEQLEESLYWIDRLGEFRLNDETIENNAIFTSMEQIHSNYLDKNYDIDISLVLEGDIPSILNTSFVDIASRDDVDWYLRNYWNIEPSHKNPRIEYPVSYYRDGKYYKYFHNFPRFTGAKTNRLYSLGNDYYCLDYSETSEYGNFQVGTGNYYAILRKKKIDNRQVYTPIYNQHKDENIDPNRLMAQYGDRTRPIAPSSSKVLVNGREEKFQAYKIDSSNYFKLRDLAYILNNTGSSFSVSWDQASRSIEINKGAAYIPVGGEMKLGGPSKEKRAEKSKTSLLIDGKKIELESYSIGGNNYFKLRDLGESLDFKVDWDGQRKMVLIDSK